MLWSHTLGEERLWGQVLTQMGVHVSVIMLTSLVNHTITQPHKYDSISMIFRFVRFVHPFCSSVLFIRFVHPFCSSVLFIRFVHPFCREK